MYGVGWAIQFNEFDPPQDFPEWEICQLIPGTVDGFPELEVQTLRFMHLNPPLNIQEGYSDPPHWDDHSDPPHWDNYSDPPHECD